MSSQAVSYFPSLPLLRTLHSAGLSGGSVACQAIRALLDRLRQQASSALPATTARRARQSPYPANLDMSRLQKDKENVSRVQQVLLQSSSKDVYLSVYVSM